MKNVLQSAAVHYVQPVIFTAFPNLPFEGYFDASKWSFDAHRMLRSSVRSDIFRWVEDSAMGPFSKVFSYFFDFSEPSSNSYRVVLNFRNLILENHRRVIGIPTPQKYITPKSKMISLITHVYSAEWSALIGGIYRLHIYLVSNGRCLSENEREQRKDRFEHMYLRLRDLP